ncbi:MAG: ComF family protein [Ignavibacteriales bacterium]|nr:ComF family protein [Ignavibacteriales bacterium]
MYPPIALFVSETSRILFRNDLIKRRKDTQSQTTLNIEERQENVAQAFEIIAGKSQDIKNKRIIVVDDVITTGATIVSCAQELRAAGAATVIAVSAALAQ